jgi:hypothetical protein
VYVNALGFKILVSIYDCYSYYSFILSYACARSAMVMRH